MSTVLITGANRGIGLEFVSQYAAEGWRVIACCRNPQAAEALKAVEGDIHVYGLEVTDQNQINDLAKRLEGEAIDILLNNAGIYGPRLALGEMDYDAWTEVFAVNTMSPLRMAECFHDHLTRGDKKIIANITSKMGSIEDNTSGGSYIYRSTKAALNMVTKSLAEDLRKEGFTCVVLHPGWVRTDMGGPNGLIDADTSVLGMRSVLNNLKDEQTGCFFNYNGSMIPW